MRLLLSIALLLALCVPVLAQDKPKAVVPTPSITISAGRSAQLRAQADEAQKDARLAEALRRVALLEAVLEALGVDLTRYEASADAEGRIVLTPKKEDKEKK